MVNNDAARAITQLSAERIRLIASQVLGADVVTVGDLSVQKIGLGAGHATAGIFRVSGRANVPGGTESWSAVVKALGVPEHGSPDVAHDGMKELEIYRSHAFRRLCGGVRAPKCYAIYPQTNVHLLWLEDLTDAPQPPWTYEQFIIAARHLGQFNAHWPADELPAWEWLSYDYLSKMFQNSHFQKAIDQLSTQLELGLVRRFVTRDAADELVQMWEESDMLVESAKAAPQGVCHVDCHPKNLFPMTDPVLGSYTVAIDWAMVGIDALGVDIAHLIGSPLLWLELSVQEAEALVDPVFDAYVEGLRVAGWAGDVTAVRRSYCTRLAYEAIRANTMISYVSDNLKLRKVFEGRLGYPMEEIAGRWGDALPLMLACHDEARQLAKLHPDRWPGG